VSKPFAPLHTTNKGAKTMTIAHLSEPLRARPPITRLQFVQYLLCQPLYIMITLMVTEALLAALTTWLMIRAGRAVTNNTFMVSDLIWIFVAQSASYLAGALSWYFAERAGFRAFGRYMLQFARDNRSYTRLLSDKQAREEVEPFLTNTTFINIFNFMYEMEDQLKLLLGLIFNSIVLGVEIDAGLPAAYAATFAILMAIQLSVRRRIADIYLENQRQNNRVIAHGYTAWDNVFSGNRYNRRLWLGGFKSKLRDCFRAQVKAIMAREGLSALGGIIGLAIVFSTMTYVVIANAGDTEVLIALAATLPRQIEMTNQVHQLTSGWNDNRAVRWPVSRMPREQAAKRKRIRGDWCFHIASPSPVARLVDRWRILAGRKQVSRNEARPARIRGRSKRRGNNSLARKIGRPIEGSLNTVAACKSADQRDPFLGCRFSCGSRLCRKLEHCCFLIFKQVS
jgi:hypothetical protein